MASAEFCQDVLRGLSSQGFDDIAIASMTGLSAGRLRRVQIGQTGLTDRQLASIERITGLTCGQLAAAALEPNGGPLTEISGIWAEARLKNKRGTKKDTRRHKPRKTVSSR